MRGTTGYPRGEGPCTNDMVAWYRMNETSGITVADSTSNSNHGTSFRDTSLMTTAGKFGTALSFNGSDRINCGDHASLQLTGAMTLSCWVQYSVVNSNSASIVVKSDASPPGSRGYGLALFPALGNTRNVLSGSVSSDGIVTYGGSGIRIILPNAWYHACMTYSPDGGGTAIKLFIDGVLDIAYSGPASQFSNNGIPLCLGTRSTSYTYALTGKMDDVRIYSRALTASEVKILAMRGR